MLLRGGFRFARSKEGALHAAVITSGGVTTVAGNGIAPGMSTDYDFFGDGSQPGKTRKTLGTVC